MKIFIGNLSTSAGEAELKGLFQLHGKVSSATIVYDKYTHRSRGFGYIEMEEQSEALSAIAKLNNTFFVKQSIVVREERGMAIAAPKRS